MTCLLCLRTWLRLTIAIGCYLTLVHTQVIQLGSCPEVKVVTQFKFNEYMGMWYENRKYFDTFSFGQRCVTSEYGMVRKDLTVKNFGVQRINGKNSTATATIRLVEPPSGKLGLTYYLREEPIWVLGTDYTSYSVVWSCFNRGPINYRSASILTRDIKPANDTINLALDILKLNNIDRRLLRLTQQNC